jgi:hypothetical protein
MPITKAPRDNALQSKRLANDIALAEQLIHSVLGQPGLLLALAPIGFNETELNVGLGFFRTAQEKFNARQEALSIATETKTTRDHALEFAKNEFMAYRQTVQVNYRGADRANLGASGAMAADIEKFRTNARSAYTAASKSPYIEVLAKYGFTPERFTLALGTLDELAATDSACKSAQGSARAATEERDIAGNALTTWLTKFRKLSRIALKSRPELLALLQA